MTYVTNMYSLEYDGFTDFPRYPLNLLADVNAFLGIETLHGTYLNGGVDGGRSRRRRADRQRDYVARLRASRHRGHSSRYHHMILETDTTACTRSPRRWSGSASRSASLLGPDLTTLINLGYGGDNVGYSDAPPNVATPFGLFPTVST